MLIPKNAQREAVHILYLNHLADKLSDSFNYVANVTKSHIRATNAYAHLERLIVQTTPIKRGHGKDFQPRKRRT